VNAGRELDILIAEKVFGLTVSQEFDEPCVPALRDCYDEWGMLPHYSTDISDAWLLLQRFHEQTTDEQEIQFFCLIEKSDFPLLSAPDAAYTICTAVLQTLGVEVVP
jgi:hypothetical protein